jgi:hypothetical protein
MRVKTFVSAGLLLLLMLGATPVFAAGIPALPHAFYGTVTINNTPAEVGTRVSASGTGVTTGIPQNPVTTTVAGQYGTGGSYLLVQGNIQDGAIITFYINDVSTEQTAVWHSGETTQKDLSVTIAAPPPPPPPGGGAAAIYVTTNLFGIAGSFRINSDGIIQQAITATSADGRLTIIIPAGTKALDKDGKPLSTLTAVINPTPPPPPTGANIIGLPYDFGPAGATFDPPITITWSYDPAALPTGVAEEDLVIAYYDATAGKWVELVCVVDAANNRITASVAHFTTFAIIGKSKPAPAPPPPAPAPPEEEVVVVPPPVEEVVPPVVVVPPVEEVQKPEVVVTPPAKANWPLIGGVIAAVVIVGLFVILLMTRRRA